MNNLNFDDLFFIINNNQNSLLGREKTKVLFEEFISINKKGITAEIGIFEGLTSELIAKINGDNFHFCYDTFAGVINSNQEVDKVPNGTFSCCLENVKNKINMQKVIYKIGVFPETFEENNLEFTFVHSDTDTYFGAKATFDCFSNIMIIGGKILFDDYKWDSCPGIEKAINEFLLVNKNYDKKEFENQCVLTRLK
jgi:hypothetical protein